MSSGSGRKEKRASSSSESHAFVGVGGSAHASTRNPRLTLRRPFAVRLPSVLLSLRRASQCSSETRRVPSGSVRTLRSLRSEARAPESVPRARRCAPSRTASSPLHAARSRGESTQMVPPNASVARRWSNSCEAIS